MTKKRATTVEVIKHLENIILFKGLVQLMSNEIGLSPATINMTLNMFFIANPIGLSAPEVYGLMTETERQEYDDLVAYGDQEEYSARLELILDFMEKSVGAEKQLQQMAAQMLSKPDKNLN